jgi:hypothetical protein
MGAFLSYKYGNTLPASRGNGKSIVPCVGMSNSTPSKTIENLLIWGSQPNLENPIVSLTLPEHLSVLRSRHFLSEVIENKPHFVDRRNDSSRNGVLEARLRKGFRSQGIH